MRRWRDGDAPGCSQAGRDSTVECGKPVAVVLTTRTRRLFGNDVTSSRRTVCAFHLFTDGTAKASQEARRAATKRVLAVHTDLYERCLREEIAKRVAEITGRANTKLDQLLGEGGAG
ncbi:hypothetical protein AB0G05_19750 [Nonomuraea wenchangensis]